VTRRAPVTLNRLPKERQENAIHYCLHVAWTFRTDYMGEMPQTPTETNDGNLALSRSGHLNTVDLGHRILVPLEQPTRCSVVIGDDEKEQPNIFFHMLMVTKSKC
jgi:hypothetical protein